MGFFPSPDSFMEVKTSEEIASKTAPSTDNGATVDARGYEYAVCVLALGFSSAGSVLTAGIQESSDGSSWSNITATIKTYTDSQDYEVHVGLLRMANRKRYLRWSGAVATANMTWGGFILLCNPEDTGELTTTWDWEIA